MIIVNATLNGERIYDITVYENAVFRVSAFDLESAIDIMANYIESKGAKNLYFDGYELAVMVECSKYRTVEAFAEVNNLTRCGTNGIYLEITSVKGGE